MRCQSTTRRNTRCCNRSVQGSIYCEFHWRVPSSGDAVAIIPSNSIEIVGVRFEAAKQPRPQRNAPVRGRGTLFPPSVESVGNSNCYASMAATFHGVQFHARQEKLDEFVANIRDSFGIADEATIVSILATTFKVLP